MNDPQKTCITIASLFAFAAGSALGEQPQKASAAHRQQVTAIAIRTLALQPGDQALLNDAILTPIDFHAAPNDRTFTGQLIVHAKPQKKNSASARIAPLTMMASKFVDQYVVDVPAGMTEGELATILLATGDYEFVEPNWLLYPTVIPNDSQFGSSWQHSRLDSAAAWDLHTGTSEIVVAVCDTGIELNHPDLAGSFVSGYHAPSDTPQSEGGDVSPVTGHGTFVAGCAAARGNNNNGVVGVGWNFSIMPVRVSDNSDGTASSFSLTEGARWAAENGAKIVNVSYSGGTSISNQYAGRYIKSHGGLLFWAAGNSNIEVTPNRPDYVMVSSTTSSDRKSGFSNFGPAIDIAAPGSSVRSTRLGGSYGNSSGTSYASPIAAGVGAMIYSVNPDFSGDDVQAILYSSVDDLGASGRDDSFGRGRVNTRKAVETALSYIRPIPTPISEAFDSNTWQDLFVATSGTIQVSGANSSALEINDNDIVETVPLSGQSILGTASVSFMLKSQSIEPGDFLEVQYLQPPETGNDQWATLHSITGQGLSQTQFVPIDIVLPEDFEWHGTKIRFVTHSSDQSDTWFIDSFTIQQKPNLTAPFEENFESESLSGFRWQADQQASVSNQDSNFFAQLNDEQSIESQNIPLDGFGFANSYIRFEAWKDNSTSPVDQILVEALSGQNNWIPAGTISTQSLTSSPQLFGFDVPIPARWIPDMRLRLSAATTGAIYIDSIYVGFDQLNDGCSQADLVEPYGELDFFDVSEFLSAYSTGSQAADLNADGAYDFFDIAAFLELFSAGCP